MTQIYSPAKFWEKIGDLGKNWGKVLGLVGETQVKIRVKMKTCWGKQFGKIREWLG